MAGLRSRMMVPGCPHRCELVSPRTAATCSCSLRRGSGWLPIAPLWHTGSKYSRRNAARSAATLAAPISYARCGGALSSRARDSCRKPAWSSRTRNGLHGINPSRLNRVLWGPLASEAVVHIQTEGARLIDDIASEGRGLKVDLRLRIQQRLLVEQIVRKQIERPIVGLDAGAQVHQAVGRQVHQ